MLQIIITALLAILGSVIGAIVLKVLYERSRKHVLSPHLLAWQKKGKYIDVNGHQIFCMHKGKFEKHEDTLILFHGFPESSHVYSSNIDLLAAKFSCVIAFDFLGFGLSDKCIYHLRTEALGYLVQNTKYSYNRERFWICSRDQEEKTKEDLIKQIGAQYLVQR